MIKMALEGSFVPDSHRLGPSVHCTFAFRIHQRGGDLPNPDREPCRLLARC